MNPGLWFLLVMYVIAAYCFTPMLFMKKAFAGKFEHCLGKDTRAFRAARGLTCFTAPVAMPVLVIGYVVWCVWVLSKVAKQTWERL